MKNTGKFSSSLLHPRYWFTRVWPWRTLATGPAPYPVLMRLGAGAGKISRHFLQRRERITRRNIELCFPGISEEKQNI